MCTPTQPTCQDLDNMTPRIFTGLLGLALCVLGGASSLSAEQQLIAVLKQENAALKHEIALLKQEKMTQAEGHEDMAFRQGTRASMTPPLQSACLAHFLARFFLPIALSQAGKVLSPGHRPQPIQVAGRTINSCHIHREMATYLFYNACAGVGSHIDFNDCIRGCEEDTVEFCDSISV